MDSTVMKKCIFCGEIDKPTVEHMIPQWLQHRTGLYTADVTNVHMSFMGTPLDERVHKGRDLILGGVCPGCNNVWLNSMESNFIPIYEDLVNRKLRRISQEKANNIAKWVYKTSLALNRGSNARKSIPPEHYFGFRKTNTVQGNTVVDIAYLARGIKMPFFEKQTTPMIITLKKGHDLVHEDFLKMHYTILCFEGVLFRVISIPWADYKIRRKDTKKSARVYKNNKNIISVPKSPFSSLEEFEHDIYIEPST